MVELRFGLRSSLTLLNKEGTDLKLKVPLTEGGFRGIKAFGYKHASNAGCQSISLPCHCDRSIHPSKSTQKPVILPQINFGLPEITELLVQPGTAEKTRNGILWLEDSFAIPISA
jgi:hypothetical protein